MITPDTPTITAASPVPLGIVIGPSPSPCTLRDCAGRVLASRGVVDGANGDPEERCVPRSPLLSLSPRTESVVIIHRERDVRHGKDQDRAATVGGRFRARRWVTRLLYRLRGRRSQNSSGLDVARSDVPGAVRQRILREYHDARVARARRTSEQLVRAGFNTGGVPYGYRARHLRVTPAGRRPRWRTRLVIEPVEAATVKMIFYWRGAEGLAVTVIRERLVAARYPAPLNPGIAEPGVWTHAIITAILRNPKYVGRQVWGRRHYGRRAPREVWVWSPVWAHPPIVSAEEFVAANRDTRLALTLPVAEGSTAERTVGGRHD